MTFKKAMQIIWTVLAIVFLALMFMRTQSDFGRYEIIAGKHRFYDFDSIQEVVSDSIFLIDTKTGDVKRFTAKIMDGNYSSKWVPTNLPRN